MPPFTVWPEKSTPAGTCTVKFTSTSMLFVLFLDLPFGLHSLSSRARRGVGYRAQMVTPPECSITSNSMSSAFPRRCSLISAVTSTSLPLEATARISPDTPSTSITSPFWMRPLQSKSWAFNSAAVATNPAIAATHISFFIGLLSQSFSKTISDAYRRHVESIRYSRRTTALRCARCHLRG